MGGVTFDRNRIMSENLQDDDVQARGHDAENEDDWEYEYSQHETEDFYLTLDLTTHVPDAVGIDQRFLSARAKHTAAAKRSSTVYNDDFNDTEMAAEKALQVLDIHTTNPLIKFDNGIYSCYWLTDLGTQLYISRPGATSEPLRPGHVLDVIGTSQVHLIGKPVQVQPKDDRKGLQAEGSASTNAIQIGDAGSDIESGEATPVLDPAPGQQALEPLVISRDGLKDSNQLAQASFFERLSAIKLKRGESDVIPTGGVRHYTPPGNKDEIRKRALAHETETLNDAQHGSTETMSKRPRIDDVDARASIEAIAAPPKSGKQTKENHRGVETAGIVETQSILVEETEPMNVVPRPAGSTNGVDVATANRHVESSSPATAAGSVGDAETPHPIAPAETYTAIGQNG